MVEFLFVPAVVGICVYGLYSIFELFARRKERMLFIEKMGAGSLSGDIKFGKIEYSNKFSGLKWAALLLGIGLGLLIGFIIGNHYVPYDQFVQMNGNGENWRLLQNRRELLGIIYGSSCLLFGGLGLLSAFLLEYKLSKKNKE